MDMDHCSLHIAQLPIAYCPIEKVLYCSECVNIHKDHSPILIMEFTQKILAEVKLIKNVSFQLSQSQSNVQGLYESAISSLDKKMSTLMKYTLKATPESIGKSSEFVEVTSSIKECVNEMEILIASSMEKLENLIGNYMNKSNLTSIIPHAALHFFVRNSNKTDIDNTISHGKKHKLCIELGLIVRLQSLVRGYMVRKTYATEIKEIKRMAYQKKNHKAKFVPKVKENNDPPKIITVEKYKILEEGFYSGTLCNGMKVGKGIMEWKDGSKYDGEWKDNKAHGKGKFYHINGHQYEGNWENNKANGEGTYTHKNGAFYKGMWKDDMQHGYGIEHWADGGKYEGNYLNGEKHGNGSYLWADCSKYTGNWAKNKINGKGTNEWSDGRKYYGDWVNNNMEGYGVYTWSDGRRYEGQYLNDKKSGYGVYTWPDGRKYEGNWMDGRQHGEGKYILKTGVIKQGVWEGGKRLKWIRWLDIDGKELEMNLEKSRVNEKTVS